MPQLVDTRELAKRNRIMEQFGDDDRHGKDPDTFDAENPLTWYPTKSPVTLSPTKSTTNVPSHAPSSLPTAKPHLPTSTPSREPTRQPHAPTGNPTLFPTVSPTCFIDTGNGNFGDVGTINANVLSYVYEMETDPSSEASISQEVIPSLENQMLKMLIPNYFEDYCSVEENIARKLLIQGRTVESGGTMMGISSLPADKVMTQGCQTTTISGTCTSIEGRMSIFVDGESDLLSSELMDSIEEGMKNDAFKSAHPSIRKLVFIGKVNDLSPTRSPSEDSTDDNTDGGTSRSTSNRMMTTYVLLGVGSVITFAAAAQFIRRRRKNQRVADRGIGFDDDLSSGDSSMKSFDEFIEFEPSNAHDLDTVVVSNRADSNEMELNVDLESFETEEKAKDGGFDFFDLILRRSNPSSSGRNERTQKTNPETVAENDEMSEISF
eukprot:CAMPEP_0176488132 /NCGR_PEP_ID=MMETSP0200_2-20121128/6541_1 /TAXON_ID=947934 /ORGANISM="Chaetoceros sp., Strain GSL56" /LENGTH=434 /DNA_ID=CAMNT_0017885085 /DNA_START=446 /DNA_END=1750 /DNA_ORIENTATION=+